MEQLTAGVEGPITGATELPATSAFQDLFDNGAVPLHMVDGDGVLIHANKAELELLGYEAREYIGRHISEFHIDQHVIADIIERLARGEILRAYPARLRARDGTIRHVQITSSALLEQGRVVNTRCFSVDVTSLVAARAELRSKDDEMRQLLDALPAAVYTTDREGRITYYNRAAAVLAGREPVIGQDMWCVTYRLRLPDGTPLPHEQCPMAITLKENRPVRGVEAIAERPDGTLVPFMPFPTPLTDGNGELVGAVNMLVDVSARKAAEANQQLLLRELNHRVKNNLQMLYALLRGNERDAVQDEARKVIGDAAQRVASIAAAQQALYSDSHDGTVEAGEFLDAVCTALRGSLGSDVSVRMEAGSFSLPDDAATPLALMVNELITNGAKYGRQPDGRGEVSVVLAKQGGEIILTVSDTGPGFRPEQASGRRASGLGLVRGLANQLEGTLTIEAGKGARCTVRFPCHRTR